jgi:hypothetical protein
MGEFEIPMSKLIDQPVFLLFLLLLVLFEEYLF